MAEPKSKSHNLMGINESARSTRMFSGFKSLRKSSECVVSLTLWADLSYRCDMPFAWRKFRPVAISRTIKLASRSVKRPRFMIWVNNGPVRRSKRRWRAEDGIWRSLTAFHFLKDQIEIIIVFEKIDNTQNVFTTATMIIDIDFFEHTRSIRVASFADDLNDEHLFSRLLSLMCDLKSSVRKSLQWLHSDLFSISDPSRSNDHIH